MPDATCRLKAEPAFRLPRPLGPAAPMAFLLTRPVPLYRAVRVGPLHALHGALRRVQRLGLFKGLGSRPRRIRPSVCYASASDDNLLLRVSFLIFSLSSIYSRFVWHLRICEWRLSFSGLSRKKKTSLAAGFLVSLFYIFFASVLIRRARAMADSIGSSLPPQPPSQYQ